MRWLSPKYGDTRIVSWFALMPVWIPKGHGQYETRWLERITAREEYREGIRGGYWWRVCFLDSTVGKSVEESK